MEDTQIVKDVRLIMVSLFDLDVQNLPTSLNQKDIIKWDSIQHLHLIDRIETHFNIVFEPEEYGIIIVFDVLCNCIEAKLSCVDSEQRKQTKP